MILKNCTVYKSLNSRRLGTDHLIFEGPVFFFFSSSGCARIFFSTCSIYFFSRLTVHDFFFLYFCCAGIFFGNWPTPHPPLRKIKWSVPYWPYRIYLGRRIIRLMRMFKINTDGDAQNSTRRIKLSRSWAKNLKIAHKIGGKICFNCNKRRAFFH